MKIDTLNLSTYSKAQIVDEFNLTNVSQLQEPEQYLFGKLKAEILGKKILDIGVGGGRTTAFLLALASDYTGIDYSPAMVEQTKKAFPKEKIFVGDARNMSNFQNDEFDFILFSFNGIDYVNHDDRMKILAEIHRVLKPGGNFVFSTHNKLYFKGKFQFVYPRKSIKYLGKNLKGLFNHLRNKKFEIHTNDYSIVNDKAHNYELLTYYITMEKQKDQLIQAGFLPEIEAVHRNGKILLNESESKDSVWIYYWAKK